VFLSYASEDAEPARKICDALRAAGIEVWFDQNELRGGDAWDRSIRQQIHDCRLFIPVISARTEARDEGYFRREWKLAADRTHDRADDRPFIVPVAIDSTSERSARVPDSFRHVQWTRLPDGETPTLFVERIRRLLSPAGISGPTATLVSLVGKEQIGKRTRRRKMVAWGALAALLLLFGSALWVLSRFHRAPATAFNAPMAAPNAPSSGAASAPEPAAFSPPLHSIAVLPFVNMSGEKDQEYFSDGMTEELITSLSQVSSLKVIARTSSFAFKGRNIGVSTIARTLNVSSILEGSVRRAGSKVRVTVQLIDGRDGFHLWSQDYDRDLKNTLAMQSDVATAVAEQMKVELLGDEATKIEEGGTRNPEAYDAFLRAREKFLHGEDKPATALAEKSVQLDPGFARGWAWLSSMYTARISDEPTRSAEWLARARAAAETALRLAPRLARAHTAKAWVAAYGLDWASAVHEVDVATSIDPHASATLNARGNLSYQLGHWQDAITAARAAIELDPLAPGHRGVLAGALGANGQHREAELVYRETMALKLEGGALAQGTLGSMAAEILFDNRPADALSEAERVTDKDTRDCLLAMIYYALGRRRESDQIVAAYERQHAIDDTLAIAALHAYRGETDLAFQWLDRGVKQHAPGLFVIKGNFAPFPNVTGDARFPELLKRIGLPVS
jgi:TolB-like protein